VTAVAPAVYPNSRGDYAGISNPLFRWQDHLARYDPRLLEHPEGRRAIGRLDPLAFALIYLRHWLGKRSPETGNKITFAPMHAASYDWALSWIGPQEPMANRHAWIAPRGSAKSTIHFRILPLWSLAYLHKDYIAIFTKATSKAEEHMTAIRQELRTNPLLRLDFPELCKPKASRGKAVHDTLGAYMAKSGAIITATGMDASVLGASLDGRRANVIVLDDVESDESNYSVYQAEKRRRTIVGAIGFYNTNAIWSWAGTTTMYGSLTHQLVRHAGDAPEDVGAEDLEWITEEKIQTHHFRPLANVNGELVSTWPARWSTEYLLSIRHTRTFAMEMDNMPSLGDEGMWRPQDFTYVPEASEDQARQALFVDPAVTATSTSDYSGLAVLGYPFPSAEMLAKQDPGWVELLHSSKVRKTGRALRDHIMGLLTRFPNVKRIIVEDNQGAALWTEVFEDLPVPVELIHSSMAKEVRAAHALTKYQARPTQVVHVGRFPEVEGTMQAFPLVAHDDDLDAVVFGVLYWLSPAEVRKPGSRQRGPTVTGSRSYAR
jgi:hypothetical protein